MRLRNNLLANIAGSVVLAALSLLFVPIYVRKLGVESYGLIGFFATLQAIVSLLDLGIGSAANRQLARLRAESGGAQKMRSLVRTLEVVYWLIGFVLVIVLSLVSAPAATHWLHPGRLDNRAVTLALILMAISFGIRWPSTLYTGGLLGLERQVLLNTIRVSTEVVRNLGALFVLHKVAATLSAFLIWQIAAALIGTLALAIALWRSLPVSNEPARFSSDDLARIWRFAAGLTGVSLTVVALTQLDKLVLGRLLPLTEYGYYMLAVAVAGIPGFATGAIFSTVFPRFSQFVVNNSIESLASTFERATQIMAALVAPAAITVAVFAEDTVYLWSHDHALALGVGGPLRILILGNMLNAFVVVPYAVQLAYGWTRLAFFGNLVAIAVLLPLILFLVPRFGAIGAAWCWLLVNLGYVVISMQVMFRRMLSAKKRAWYVYSVVLPVAVSLAICLSLRQLGARTLRLGYGPQLAVVTITLSLCMVTLCLVLPETRSLLISLRSEIKAVFPTKNS